MDSRYPEQKQTAQLLGPILIVMGVLFWPLSDSLVKYMYQNTGTGTDSGILTIIMYAMFLRGLFLYIGSNIRYYKIMPLDPSKRLWRHPDFVVSIFRGLTSFVSTVCILMAIVHLSLGQAMSIFYVAPFVASVFAPLILGDKFRVMHLSCLVIGFIGIYIIAMPAIEMGGDAINGYGYALVGMFFGAFYMLLCRRYRQGHQSVGLRTTGFIYMAGGLLFPIFANMMGYAPDGAPMGTIADAPTYFASLTGQQVGIFAAAIITGILGVTIGQIGFSYTNILIGSLLGYSELVWCWILDYMIFDMSMGMHTLVGALVIVSAGIYNIYKNL